MAQGWLVVVVITTALSGNSEAEMVFVGRFPAAVLSVIMLAAACCAVTIGTALPAGASEPAVGTWGAAQQVPGVWALSTGSETAFKSGINSLSCGSAGNCAAGGGYTHIDGAVFFNVEQAFVVDESGGSWGTAQQVPGLAALSTGVWYPGSPEDESSLGIMSVINSVSCGSAGNCAAGGEYADSAGAEQAFVVNESGGSWGDAEEVPGSAFLNAGGEASVSSVSCPSAGNCAAAGTYTDSTGRQQAFVVDETGGAWGNAEKMPGSAALDGGGSALIDSVSCASAGNCAAGGWYAGADGEQAFVVDETAGTWGAAQEVPGSAALNTYGGARVQSVSCPSAGNCTAVGSLGHVRYLQAGATAQAFVADETKGSWGTAKLLPGTAPPSGAPQDGSVFDAVSCGSAGNCVAVGDINTGVPHPLMAVESGGSWGAARQVPGLTGSALSVSCPSAGNCAIGGNGYPAAFVLDETGGSWGTAHELTRLAGQVSAAVSSVSCASAAQCAAAGSYVYSYGDTGPSISGVAVAFVVDEKPSTSSALAASVSAARTLTVAKATAKITLPAARVTVKHATTTTMPGVSGFLGVKTMLTAKVKGGSLPKGWVKFIALAGPPDFPEIDGKTLCSAVLSDGVARCSFIPYYAGSWRVEALYEGNMSHKPSHAVATVNETWVRTTTTLAVSADPTVGKPVMLTATVQASPSPATDILIFYFDGGGDCITHLVDGTASCAYTWDVAGTYHVTAEYMGDVAHLNSSADTLVTVAAPPPKPTATTVATVDGTDTATAGEQVTLVGTVNADVLGDDSDAAYGPPNQDTITFLITGPGGFSATCANVALTGEGNPVNTADCPVTLPTAGTYDVTAAFAGDQYATASTGTATLTVNEPESG